MWDTLIIKPFISVLLFIYDLIGKNFGLAIILFTVIIKLVTQRVTVIIPPFGGVQGECPWLH